VYDYHVEHLDSGMRRNDGGRFRSPTDTKEEFNCYERNNQKSSEQKYEYYCIDKSGMGELSHYRREYAWRCFSTKMLDSYIEKN
jgi:hypothetical protein